MDAVERLRRAAASEALGDAEAAIAAFGEADEQGVRMDLAHGRSDLQWTLIYKVVLTPNLVTIYQLSATIGKRRNLTIWSGE